MKNLLLTISLLIPFIFLKAQDKPLYQTEKYSIFANRVEQSPYQAIAISPNELFSNYQSPDYSSTTSIVQFKFSINSRDNEMVSGSDHLIKLRPVNGEYISQLITFGQTLIDTIGPQNPLPENTYWHVKLDMRTILNAFENQGYFTLFNGQQLYKNDFKGVYIAGDTSPLSWDFENLYTTPSYELTDKDLDGIYEATFLMNPKKSESSFSTWKQSSDLSSFPIFHSDQPLSETLYNLSLEEMLKDIRPDGTFMAGEKWDGVWTRDISYAIHLAMAAINPEVSKASLMRKVKNKRIIQDTGTGGSWPVSTDRSVWAVAAWEIYTVSGDSEWLKQSFEIIKNTWDDDIKTAYNKETGMYFGESSFLDWREQSYPKWMEPVHIYKSQNLGTNAIHYEVAQILVQMANILDKPADEYLKIAGKLKNRLNKWLWLPEKGYYAQYLYGENYQIPSPRSEALGEALTVLFDIADSKQQKRIINSTPVTEFGIPCIFPQIPQIQPYHNNAVWPFVQAYWALASAKTGNEEALMYSIAAIYRQSALFLTNKENFVAYSGDGNGTAINSNRQLWSVAANLALVYKVYFGMNFQADGLYLNPFIPEPFKGEKELNNFKYRNAILDIKISGFGNHIQSFEIDGLISENAFIPGNLKGKHSISMILDNKLSEKQTINYQQVDFSLPAPQYRSSADTLYFPASDLVQKYIVYRNGKKMKETSKSQIYLPFDDFYTEYMLTAVDQSGYETFSNKPLKRIASIHEQMIEAELFSNASQKDFKGFSGSGFIELSKDKNNSFPFILEAESEGDYFISFIYSNGSGPVNTNNKCAIRSLLFDNEMAGTIVMPQRGMDEWSNWGESNAILVHLPKGRSRLSLDLIYPQNRNMNGDINAAMLDAIMMRKVK